jgi:predicted nucleotidyltransferase
MGTLETWMKPPVRRTIRDDLDHVLGSILKVRVIRAMTALEQPVSGRQVGRLAGVSSKALTALDELAALGVVKKVESTGQHFYSLNQAHYLAEPLTVLFRTEERRISDIRDVLKHALTRRRDVLSGAIFGSVARSDADPHSDLDVLLIIESRAGSAEILDLVLEQADTLAKIYGATLAPTIFTKQEWLALMKRRDPFALSASADARVFVGRPLTELAKDEQKRKKKAG